MPDIIVTKPKEKALVKRHNHLIEARYRLTLQEQRLLLWLFSEIKPEDTDFKRYRVRIADLAKLIGISDGGGRLYREIIEVTGRLRKREIDIEDISRNVIIQATWIASAEYQFNEGVVEICLAPALIPYLLDIRKNYTTVALKYVIGVKSAYAIRLYELLKQYQGIGSRVVSIADLR